MVQTPDSVVTCFYQEKWNLVGDGICAAILECLNIDRSLESIHSTFITLIPKVPGQKR